MKNKEDGKKRLKNYVKFSSIALQMGIVIAAAALGGDWLDDRQKNEFPVWTLILTLIAIFGSLYQIIREVLKMSKDDEDT